MKLFVIDAGNFMADGGALFGVIPKIMWEKQYPADDDNYCNLKMRCLLVDTGDRKVLIDTGAGTKQSEKFFSYSRLNGNGNLHQSLKSAGYSYADITDVVLTHLHWDHCGGCVYYDEENKPQVTFKKATHWVSSEQWNNYTDPNKREGAVYFADNMMPVHEDGLLKTVEESRLIIPGIHIELFNGHTAGNMVPIVHTPKGALAFMGDLVPVLPCIQALWVSAYDTQPLVSIDEKERFLKQATQQNISLFFEHDLYTECCAVEHTKDGLKAAKTFSLKEFINSDT